MADNTAITPGAGETIRGKDRSGVKTQIVGIDVGIGGSESLMTGSNPMPVAQQGTATATESGVAASASSGTILASNAARRGACIANDSTSAVLYLRLSASAASIASGGYTVALVAGAYYEVPFWYTGQITGIWAAATGYANITEVVA